MTLIRLPETNDPREVWVSGTEIVRFVDELIDGVDTDKRMTGRTSRLACKYVELAMQYPNCRVIVKDHYDKTDSNRRLLQMVTQILNVLNIDYEMGEIPEVVKDPSAFTGSVPTGNMIAFIKATPKTK